MSFNVRIHVFVMNLLQKMVDRERWQVICFLIGVALVCLADWAGKTAIGVLAAVFGGAFLVAAFITIFVSAAVYGVETRKGKTWE